MSKKTLDLSNYLNSDIPENLYHYTTIQGFQGIIESSEIWMSNLFYLNDKSEYKLGVELLKKHLNIYKNGFSVLKATKYFVEALESAIQYIESNESIFILSLTANSNLLSQWRGYTNNGIGINIGFKKDFFKKNQFNIYKCIYDVDAQDKMISHLVTESIFMFVGVCHTQGIFENQDKFELKEFDKAVTIVGNIFMDRAILACSLIKNSHFVEEDEWRVVYSNKELDINFLNRSLYLKPYVKFPIENIGSIISEINIGPNPEQILCEISIKAFLKKHIINNCKIICCDIPYRN
ncbi:DUF2971 domain-containing protein [Sphingobacterium bovistauri]|uniref:DUF2971 domain-containing protein n=1 Tax=Sphingobacterium bovistauri TaxID=2781959 RepID=A0ABS7Z6I2_9SPHI|nr:DUF2971 domain-containing protein [Sphingobacterium bovistauri]MCA5005796.1 DUF2971 domain-containing protein [Sphingobacterium bovistauri]